MPRTKSVDHSFLAARQALQIAFLEEFTERDVDRRWDVVVVELPGLPDVDELTPQADSALQPEMQKSVAKIARDAPVCSRARN